VQTYKNKNRGNPGTNPIIFLHKCLWFKPAIAGNDRQNSGHVTPVVKKSGVMYGEQQGCSLYVFFSIDTEGGVNQNLKTAYQPFAEFSGSYFHHQHIRIFGQQTYSIVSLRK
jgi:hypothetical protein